MRTYNTPKNQSKTASFAILLSLLSLFTILFFTSCIDKHKVNDPSEFQSHYPIKQLFYVELANKSTKVLTVYQRTPDNQYYISGIEGAYGLRFTSPVLYNDVELYVIQGVIFVDSVKISH